MTQGGRQTDTGLASCGVGERLKGAVVSSTLGEAGDLTQWGTHSTLSHKSSVGTLWTSRPAWPPRTSWTSCKYWKGLCQAP